MKLELVVKGQREAATPCFDDQQAMNEAQQSELESENPGRDMDDLQSPTTTDKEPCSMNAAPNSSPESPDVSDTKTLSVVCDATDTGFRTRLTHA